MGVLLQVICWLSSGWVCPAATSLIPPLRERSFTGGLRSLTELICNRGRLVYLCGRLQSVSFTMIWLSLLLLPLVAAALGTFLAGAVASLAVRWYRITSREGASGYFVVSVGLLGLVAGLLIGLIACVIVRPESLARFGLAAALGIGVVVVLALVAGIIARLLADVPPTIEGESLLLRVEVRERIAEMTASPAGPGFVSLGSLKGRTVRKSFRGPLWTEQASDASGFRISSGVVEIFTSRGKRLLMIDPGAGETVGYFLRLSAFPGRKFFNWSEWLPKTRPGADPRGRLTYRFRIQKHYDPIRRETVSSFEILTIAERFAEIAINRRPAVQTNERFQIFHNGSIVAGKRGDSRLPDLNLLATFEGQIAILVNHIDPNSSCSLRLITESNGAPVVQPVADSSYDPILVDLDPDAAPPPAPRRNRIHFSHPGPFRVGQNGVLDTRTLAIHRFTLPSRTIEQVPLNCLALSPDLRTFVRLVTVSGSDSPALAATDYVGDQTDILPIDRMRMRYIVQSQIDPAWVDHHFCWVRNSVGIDRLIQRESFETLPFQGIVEQGTDGNWRYTLHGVYDIRPIILDVLVGQLGGRPAPPSANTSEQPIQLEGGEVSLFYGREYGNLLMLRMPKDASLEFTQKIARAIDAELATGKHDSMFDLDGAHSSSG
jgi:hypothetical protein